jgi:uroporphyrinogen III methyltransferase/synthase
MAEIVGDAASAYKGVIPADRYHEPYMPLEELRAEIAAGVRFWGAEVDGELVGVMGIQDVDNATPGGIGDVALIRHAYVRTAQRGLGIGGQLLTHLMGITQRPLLMGTWAAADWAVRFYQKHGFTLTTHAEKETLLRIYWNIPARQVETSVVLADARAITMLRNARLESTMSTVYLIGAGPGDPGLLTVRAKELIETCDVVVYDYLANKEFLKYARKDAEIIYVGKKGGDHTLPQDQINQLIIDKAKEGKSVARLKGGDPYVFGRGGEEAEELVEAGIAFEVVPGVTAGVAAPAYAGIPVTHRDHTTSVCFITGHEDPTKEETGHNWEVYAKSTSTLVFYMGVKNLPMIAGNLISNGRDPKTPVALVRWGTRCNQESMVATLETVAAEAEKRKFAAPSIIIVGGVCSLASKLAWFEKKPLLGKGVVVTRAREQASDLADVLKNMGACVFEFPTITVEPLDDYEEVEKAILSLGAVDWLIFTSVNGVKHFWNQLSEIGLDTRALGGISVAAIGPATAEELKARGVTPDFIPPKYVAEEVVAGLLERGIAGKNVLIPRAKVAREVLPEELAKAGAKVRILPVYETRLTQQDPAEIVEALEKGKIQAVTFTSSSTVENFFTLLAPDTLKKYPDVKIGCIGPVTAKTLSRYGFAPDIQPEDYTIPGLAEALGKGL